MHLASNCSYAGARRAPETFGGATALTQMCVLDSAWRVPQPIGAGRPGVQGIRCFRVGSRGGRFARAEGLRLVPRSVARPYDGSHWAPYALAPVIDLPRARAARGGKNALVR